MAKTLTFSERLGNLKTCFQRYNTTCWETMTKLNQTYNPLAKKVCSKPYDLAQATFTSNKVVDYFPYGKSHDTMLIRGDIQYEISSEALRNTASLIIYSGSPISTFEGQICTQPSSIIHTDNSNCLVLAHDLDLNLNGCFKSALYDRSPANSVSATAGLLMVLGFAIYNYFSNGDIPAQDSEEIDDINTAEAGKKLKLN